MYFDKLLSKPVDKLSFGELCDFLAKANVSIYYYENKTWWSRKDKSYDAKDIDVWDELSRRWNEKRNAIKNKIDFLLKESVSKKRNVKEKKEMGFSYRILPISLLIDMLTIENIKIYDHVEKKNTLGKSQSQNKAKELVRHIDLALEDINSSGIYLYEKESRTF